MEYIVKDGVKTPFTRDTYGKPIFEKKPAPASPTPAARSGKASAKKGGDE